MCSGEEVGLLKWKETLPPLVTEQDEPSDGATNQHRIDHGAFFSNTMGQEVQNVMMIYLDRAVLCRLKSLNYISACACEVSYDSIE